MQFSTVFATIAAAAAVASAAVIPSAERAVLSKRQNVYTGGSVSTPFELSDVLSHL